MKGTEEWLACFRFTLRHSLLFATITGLIVAVYAYLEPGWVK